MRRLAQVATLTLIMVAAGCGKDDAVGPPTEESVVGTYALTIVNGAPLPFPIAGTETVLAELIAGRMQLNADHTFVDELTTRVTYTSGTPAPATQVDQRTGTFILSGSTLVLTYPEGNLTVAVTGNLLHVNNGGPLLTYKKQ